QRPGGGVPVGSLEDPGLALEPAAMGRGDVGGARREDVEDEAAAGTEKPAGRAERASAVRVTLQMEVGAERADDELDRFVDRGIGQVAETQVESTLHAGGRGSFPADVEHAVGRVDADHRNAGRGDRDGDPPRADTELDDGWSGSPRLLDVEGD